MAATARCSDPKGSVRFEPTPGAALEHLLAADSVLPEQFWTSEYGSTERSGERALMWAVFADGIDSYRRNAGATSLHRRTEFLETQRWLWCTDWDWPFSFVNLCEAFGFDPAGVRGMLQRWRREHARQTLRRQRFRPVARHAA
ncbi:MAG: hypothetical protein ACHQ4J_16200 [Candidatus Binatia bacterium]